MRVIESRLLRRIFGSIWKEVAGGWKRLHSEEFHELYASPNNIRVINSKWIRCAEHVTCMEEMQNVYSIYVG